VFLLAAWPLTRSWAWRLIAAVTRRESARRSAEAWTDVWRRRAEWLHGFTDAPQTAVVSGTPGP
jgi:hypothetical protein